MNNIIYKLTLIFLAAILFSCGTSSNDNNNNAENILTISEETVNINGLDHYIKKIGEGTPIVVLHGGPGFFHDYLEPNFKKLAEKYQIIFYDQRGNGKTNFPTDTNTITIDNYIEDLEAIRKHLKIKKMNLLGHSWGGILAVSYGKKYPDNLEKLILVSPGPATSAYFDETFNKMQARRSDEDTKLLIQSMMSTGFEERDPSIFKKTILLNDKVNLFNQEGIADLYAPVTFTKETANNFLLISSIMEKNFFDYNLIEGIEVIKCPSLVIIGDIDNVPFYSSQLLAESIENATIQVIKSTCHYPFYESPKEFNKMIKHFMNPEY